MPRSTNDLLHSATVAVHAGDPVGPNVELTWTSRAMEAHVSRSPEGNHKRILIADPDAAFRERLAQYLRAHGFEVLTAATGESAFHLLRDWYHPVGWLYTRADLPGLIDGWILADEYHDRYPDRAAVIAASREDISAKGHVVLDEPSPVAALEAIRAVASTQKPVMSAGADRQSLAA
jgi:DNA-binding NarL/FixJ family response regulator